jgi:hypothetical protein
MFHQGRQPLVRFETKNSGANPRKLLELAHEYVEQERKAIKAGEKEVWIVCDRDGHAHAAKAIELKSENIHVAFSNPCFELWLLLHYAYCSRPFHSDSTVGSKDRDDLQNEIGQYLKGFDCEQKTVQAAHHPELAGRYETARGNAIRFARELTESGQSRLEKTNTNVYELVESILECLRLRRENAPNIQVPEWIEALLQARAS